VNQRLQQLCGARRCRVVLISGRPARELTTLLPPTLKLEIWGSHGRERLNPDGGYTAVPLRVAQQTCLEQLESELHHEGLSHVLERKIGSLAMHTRGLPEEDARRILSFAHQFHCSVPTSGDHDHGLEWLPFDGGVELRGKGCTKATAVHSILRDEPDGTPAAYLGDDQTDEDAFVALRQRGSSNPSLPVLVRLQPRPSIAHLWLRPPEELLAFLDRWLQAVVPAGAR
jgi:trehalose-phosphatase